MSSTFKIFGGSDRISQLSLDRLVVGETLGLNNFPMLGHFTKYWLWIDEKSLGNCVYIKEESKYRPFFKFIPNSVLKAEQSLKGAYSSATFAIDFAIKQGFKQVELYGILDGDYQSGENGRVVYKHFYDDKELFMHEECLKSWKKEIMSYNDKIEIIIPYQTI